MILVAEVGWASSGRLHLKGKLSAGIARRPASGHSGIRGGVILRFIGDKDSWLYRDGCAYSGAAHDPRPSRGKYSVDSSYTVSAHSRSSRARIRSRGFGDGFRCRGRQPGCRRDRPGRALLIDRAGRNQSGIGLAEANVPSLRHRWQHRSHFTRTRLRSVRASKCGRITRTKPMMLTKRSRTLSGSRERHVKHVRSHTYIGLWQDRGIQQYLAWKAT